MSTEDTRESGRQDASAPVEPKNEPAAHDPNAISDADRAANPFGAARREREMHRSEDGKFAPKPDKPQQAKPNGEPEGARPEDKPEAEDRSQAGLQRSYEAERRKRQEIEKQAGERERVLQRQIDELRGMQMAGRQQQPAPQQPKPPEFWEDPSAAMDHRLQAAMSPMQEAMRQQRLGTSQMIAVQQHGAETVGGAIQALAELRQVNPQEYARLEAIAERSLDPVGDVVRWHKQTTAMREIGDDPAAYRERLRQELLAEMQAQGDPQQHAPPAAQRPSERTGPLPTSFAAQRGGGARGGEGYGGPRSLTDIMGGR